jgi:hypothetical protein
VLAPVEDASRRWRPEGGSSLTAAASAQKKVTQWGSPPQPPDDEVSVDATVTASDLAVASSSDVEAPSRFLHIDLLPLANSCPLHEEGFDPTFSFARRK